MSSFIYHLPSAIHLYEEGDLEGLDLHEVSQYLTGKTLIPVRINGSISRGLAKEKIKRVAKEFARARVKDLGKRLILTEPHQTEWDYEQRRIGDPGWRVFGIFYDGISYQKIISAVINEGKLHAEHCKILFTNQLFGTWDSGDGRYHARVSLYGFPSLISTTGLVEAPAKPKEFYFKKQVGVPAKLLEEEYGGRFLGYGDPRVTETLKGYAMQAVFFHLTGNPSCEEKDCRLFNSHWQEEVIRSQLDGKYEYCPTHEALLKEIRERSNTRSSSFSQRPEAK